MLVGVTAGLLVAIVAFIVGRSLGGRRRGGSFQPESSNHETTGGGRTSNLDQVGQVTMAVAGSDHTAMVRVKLEAQGDQGAAIRHSHVLGVSSPLVGALGDLGVASASLRGLVRVTMYGDAATAMSSGSGRLMTTLDGRSAADVVNKASGKILGKGRLSDPNVLPQISPAIVWNTLAYAVGQHFQHEMSERLGKIESRLHSLDQVRERQTNAELSAATKEVARMAGRLLDGEPAERVDTALNSQIHCIETRWHHSLLEIDAIERQLRFAQGRERLDVDDLSEFIPDVFGENATVSAVVQRFFDAM